MAMNFNFGNGSFGFTPEQLNELMTPPTLPPTGIETLADEVGMSDFTAEFPGPGFNPTFGSLSPPPDVGSFVPPPPIPPPPIPPPPGGGGQEGFGGPSFAGLGSFAGPGGLGLVPPLIEDDALPIVDPIANLTPLPPRDANVRVPTNYPLRAALPVMPPTPVNPFERPEREPRLR